MRGMALVGLLVLAVGLAGVAAANEAPLAEAGLDQDARVNSTVYIDAGGSLDPDGEIVAFEWEIERPNGTITTPDCRTCSLTQFVPYRPGRYNVTVTVTDDDGASRQDTMFVNVNGSPTSPPPSNGTGPGPGLSPPDPDVGGGSGPGEIGGLPSAPGDDQIQQEFDPDTESQLVLENSELANGEDFVLETVDGGEVRIPAAQFESMANDQGQVPVQQALPYLQTTTGRDISREVLEETIQNQCGCASRIDLSETSNRYNGDSDQAPGANAPGDQGNSGSNPPLPDPGDQRLQDFVM